MKIFQIKNLQPCTLKLTIKVSQPKLIKVITTEWNNDEAIYDEQSRIVYVSGVFEIKLPFVPIVGRVKVLNLNDVNDISFDAKMEVVKLKTYPNIYAYNNKHLLSYIQFLKDFIPRKEYLASSPHNEMPVDYYTQYKSDCGNFVVSYFDTIKMNGSDTPISMRVDKQRGAGDMDWCKTLIGEYNIPECVVIALHEFSHVNINKNPQDELEADFNSALIYCGLGFAKEYLITAWEKVYKRSPSQQNKNRLNSTYWFVKNFDNEILNRFSK